MRTFITALLMTAAVTAGAQSVNPDPNHLRLLVPIFISAPFEGALGSIWESELTFYNATGREMLIDPCAPQSFDQACTLDLASDEAIEPGETQRGLPIRFMKSVEPTNGAGVTVYVVDFARNGGRDLAVHAVVRDRSRNGRSAGTEIPVVRESAFRTTTIHLLSVPTDLRFRLTLRIYEVNHDTSEFIVRVVDESTNGEMATQLVRAVAKLPHLIFHQNPAYAQVSGLLPSPAEAGGAGLPSRVRVEIEPRSPADALFWAFLTVTNNETQEFTTITPQ